MKDHEIRTMFELGDLEGEPKFRRLNAVRRGFIGMAYSVTTLCEDEHQKTHIEALAKVYWDLIDCIRNDSGKRDE